jgi:hypothetical protein
VRYSKKPEAIAMQQSQVLIRTSLEWKTLYKIVKSDFTAVLIILISE